VIYSLHTKGEPFNADKILRWAKIPYQVINLEDVDYHPNDTIVVSPKNFLTHGDWVESNKILINHLHDKFKKVVVINDDNLGIFPHRFKNIHFLGYETKYEPSFVPGTQIIENKHYFNYLHCRVAYDKSIKDLPLIVEMLKDRVRNKHYTNLNRYPKVHRIELMEHIIKNNLLDSGYNSFVYGKEEVKEKADKLGLTPKLIYDHLPMILDLNKLNDAWSLPDMYTNSDGIPYQYTLDSYLHIITETCYENVNGVFWVSEKIAKPFAGMNFMLLLSRPGTLKWWKAKGFETFDNIFDESYDNEVDDIKRLKMVQTELDKFVNLPIKEIHDIYYRNIDKLKHNFYHFQDYASKELTKFKEVVCTPQS
tara:strand:+ start:212 stop:1306 length:1095 start_codon:yes stop_codon:yes gene_type:complete